MGPRPKPDDARPVTMKKSCRAGYAADQRLAVERERHDACPRPGDGQPARNGRTAPACPRFTAMPSGSGVVLEPTTSRSPPKITSPLRRWRP